MARRTRFLAEGTRIMDRSEPAGPFWITVETAIARVSDLTEIAIEMRGPARNDAFSDIDDLLTAIDQATVHTTPPAANVVAFSREGAAA